MAHVHTVAVLGATGPIGTQTLDVVRADPERYRVTALGAHGSVDLLAAQAREFRPAVVALADPSRAAALKSMLPAGIELLAGPDAMVDAEEFAVEAPRDLAQPGQDRPHGVQTQSREGRRDSQGVAGGGIEILFAQAQPTAAARKYGLRHLDQGSFGHGPVGDHEKRRFGKPGPLHASMTPSSGLDALA